MRMPVMLVVDVLVRHRLVGVLVLVPLGDVQPHAERHERGRGGEGEPGPLAKDEEREARASGTSDFPLRRHSARVAFTSRGRSGS